MAVNDVTVFDETKLALLDGTHDLDTHSFKVALCNNTVAPTAATATRTPMIPPIPMIIRRACRMQRSVQVILELTIYPRLLAQTHLDGVGVSLLDRAL